MVDRCGQFSFSRGDERVSSSGENLLKYFARSVSSIQTEGGVWQSVKFTDGNLVRHTLTTNHNDARRSTRTVQRHDMLDCHVMAGTASVRDRSA